MTTSVKIPIDKSKDQHVILFLDEIQDYVVDEILDVLQRELAPLNVWRECALEYYRQGNDDNFQLVLNTITNALSIHNIEASYKSKEDFVDGVANIFNCLGAKALQDYSKVKDKKRDEFSSQIVRYLKKTDEYSKMNEYSFLIKGFFEIKQGDFKRAQDMFKTVSDRTKTQPAAKKKFAFGALVGLGTVCYINKNYEEALRHFTDAIQKFPECGASGSVRVAAAACCFKLEQYRRAHDACDAAIYCEPMNTDALVLKALLLQVDAQKCDRSKRAAFRESAFENCLMARYIDSQCAPALVHMANHIFYSWKRIECECHVTGACMVRLSSTGAGQFAVGDLLRLDRLKGDPYIVRALLPDDDELVVTLDRTIEIEAGAGISSVELCELGEVVRLANEAVACSRNKDSTVEGNYILGKVCHAQGNIDKALEYYLKANESTDMMLAAFGLGQILYSKQEFSAALSIFEKIMLSYPHDKDSQAYVALLKGVLKQETTTFEILREVAVGFQLEYDLWLQQGQLRLGNPSEYGIALKCLLTARQLLITKKESIPADLLSNIAVLKQHVGQVKEALDFMTQALSYAPIRPTPVNQHTLNPDFKSSELDSVFYSWSDPLCQLKYLSFTAETSSTAFESIDAFTDLTEHVHVGDKVCIGDIVYTVNTVSEDQLEAYSPVQLDIASIDGMDEDMTPTLVLDLHLKQRGDNFYSNITLSYNLARILEELGSSGAAVEIYSEILKQHPNFIECYLRLSELARSRGRTVEAAKWLATALEVDREEPDVNISLGDLQSQGKELDRAKKSYESVIEKNKHDARALISLGNFYFSYLKSSEDTKYDSLFKNSYKFFHAALNDDSTGLYAANGLGMVFAEHGELQAAREIFTKVREESKAQSTDVGINLAHVQLAHGRFPDAEHLYQATMKLMQCSSDASKMALLNEWTSLAQLSYRRFAEAALTAQKGAHLDPTNVRLWHNIAVIHRDLCAALRAKQTRSVDDLESAVLSLSGAEQIFHHVASKKNAKFEIANKHLKACKSLSGEVRHELQSAVRKRKHAEDERRRKEEEVQLLKLQKIESAEAAAAVQADDASNSMNLF